MKMNYLKSRIASVDGTQTFNLKKSDTTLGAFFNRVVTKKKRLLEARSSILSIGPMTSRTSAVR